MTLELGGNAAVSSTRTPTRDYAAERIVWGGTANAGQTCISVQRVYVHESLDGFEDDLVVAVRARSSSATRSTRRPTSARVIDDAEAERVEDWLRRGDRRRRDGR